MKGRRGSWKLPQTDPSHPHWWCPVHLLRSLERSRGAPLQLRPPSTALVGRPPPVALRHRKPILAELDRVQFWELGCGRGRVRQACRNQACGVPEVHEPFRELVPRHWTAEEEALGMIAPQ